MLSHESACPEGVECLGEPFALFARGVFRICEEHRTFGVRRILEVRHAEADQADRATDVLGPFAVEKRERSGTKGLVVSGGSGEGKLSRRG